jgi:hypothetical protein
MGLGPQQIMAEISTNTKAARSCESLGDGTLKLCRIVAGLTKMCNVEGG